MTNPTDAEMIAWLEEQTGGAITYHGSKRSMDFMVAIRDRLASLTILADSIQPFLLCVSVMQDALRLGHNRHTDATMIESYSHIHKGKTLFAIDGIQIRHWIALIDAINNSTVSRTLAAATSDRSTAENSTAGHLSGQQEVTPQVDTTSLTTNGQENLNGQPTAKREASLSEFTTPQTTKSAARELAEFIASIPFRSFDYRDELTEALEKFAADIRDEARNG